MAFAIFLPSFFIRQYYNRRGKLHTRRVAAAEATATDGHSVIYLRSFEDDDVAAALRGERTEEEHLVRVLGSFGPVITIGKPGELLPFAGAQRQYVDDAHWQQRVIELVADARLIVVRTGLSPGLLWELRTTIERTQPDQLLLVCDDANELDQMLRQVREVHPSPPIRVRFRRKRLGSLIGFVTFDSAWRPLPLPIRSARYLVERHEHETFMYAALLHTLRPLLEQAGVEIPRPQIDPVKIAFIIFCIAFLGWIVFQIAAG